MTNPGVKSGDTEAQKTFFLSKVALNGGHSFLQGERRSASDPSFFFFVLERTALKAPPKLFLLRSAFHNFFCLKRMRSKRFFKRTLLGGIHVAKSVFPGGLCA
jgi:hypothetical protein